MNIQAILRYGSAVMVGLVVGVMLEQRRRPLNEIKMRLVRQLANELDHERDRTSDLQDRVVRLSRELRELRPASPTS